MVGLFPAGGRARRLGAIAGSKEIIPVQTSEGRSIPVGQYLLRAYAKAGIADVHIILPPAKSDIQACLGTDGGCGLSLRYTELQRPWGTPFTLDDAWPEYNTHTVALGFPDIIMQPDDAFIQLQRRLISSGADAALGLYPTDTPSKADMVRYDNSGRVLGLDIKPPQSTLRHTWITAVWTPAFSQFMHDFLTVEEKAFLENPQRPELFVGSVINAAIRDGRFVDSLIIPGGRMLDIGTPDDLARAQSESFL
jgi:glucose-1-phosphate thymidylyltransferase